jgi:hypothetical protein
LCSRVERRARRLAAGARAPVQTREKLVRQDSSLMMMKDLELLQPRGESELKRRGETTAFGVRYALF